MKYSNSEKNKNFFIETYGCQMNISDSNDLCTLLKKSGFIEVSKADEASIILINTCSVRGSAEQRVYGRLSEYKSLKKKRDFILILLGCMAINDNYILEKYPFIDYIIGTYHIRKIPEILKAENIENKIYNDFSDFHFSENNKDQKEPFKAFIPIIHGCNNFCSYCIVPHTRGREISRPSDEILENVKNLTNAEVVEIILLGQNVNSYGQDSDDISFRELLIKLNDIDKLKRIRFITSHPKDFSFELIDTIAELDKVCNHIHLPIQSANNRILKLMNRNYTYEDYYSKIEYVRKKLPNPSITTDILVGFPGETDTEYKETIDKITDIQFDEAFMYKYNTRPLTKANFFEETITEEEKNERLTNLIKTQLEITKKINNSYIGEKETILLENVSKKNKNELKGKTERNKNVVVQASPEEIGNFIPVELTSLNGNTFIGKKIRQK